MGPEGPEAGSTSDSADAGEAQGKPRRRRRGGRGRRRPSGRTAQAATDAAPAVATSEPPAPVAERPPRARHAERSSPRPEPVRAAPPADDFGFDADATPAAIQPAATEDATGAPRDDGDPRRRRRRRGGRGRRRRNGPPDADAPSDGAVAASAPEPRVAQPETADEFGALLDDSAPAAASAPDAAPSRPVEHEDGPRRNDRPARSPRPERRGQDRPRQSSRAAPFPPTPHGVDDWFSPARLEACQRAIHYHFRDLSLLENALTHSSIKSHDRPSYERMEFLGDSVIGLVIAEYLYNLLPDCDEGDLTKMKSFVVSTDGLADAAKACGLDRFLAVGRGILMKDAVPRSLIADVFEGVVGAVYLDRGYETVRLYVLDLLGPHIKEALSDRGARNFKSVLQQVAQRDFGETPFYEVLRESGPEHSRVFEVVAVVGRRRFGVARAATKKEAEQAAAKLALQTILMEKSSRKPPPRRRRSR